jgi:hypothetical protein
MDNIISSNSICVFVLEQNRIFLYPVSDTETETKNEEDITIECTLYYDYVQKYKPIKLVEVLKDRTIHDIDSMVLKYMFLYGMDYVRGGNYYEEVLPDYKTKMLEDLLNFNSIDNLENIECVSKIIEKYKNINVNEIPAKIKSLTETLDRYKKEYKTLGDYRNVKSSNYKIDNSIFLDITWIRTICNDVSYKGTLNSKQIYKRVILLLKKISEVYFNVRDSLQHDQEYIVYLKNPEFIFDKFIFHSNTYTITENDRMVAIELCEKFKYLSCFILNRIDELLFDVYESYGYDCNTDWIIPKEIFYLNYLFEKKNQNPDNDAARKPDIGVGL